MCWKLGARGVSDAQGWRNLELIASVLPLHGRKSLPFCLPACISCSMEEARRKTSYCPVRAADIAQMEQDFVGLSMQGKTLHCLLAMQAWKVGEVRKMSWQMFCIVIMLSFPYHARHIHLILAIQIGVVCLIRGECCHRRGEDMCFPGKEYAAFLKEVALVLLFLPVSSSEILQF